MKKILVASLVFFTMLFVAYGHAVNAESIVSDSSLKVEVQSVNPGDDYRYVLKRLKEKIALFVFGFSSERKADYYIDLVDVRLSELKYVVDRKDIANIQTTSQRYAAISGELTDFVLTKNMTGYNGKLVDVMSSHIPFLEKLRDSYPYDSSEYRFVQDDANSLKSHISKLSEKR